jgi:NADH-quinone oxidoreductase subunit M
MGQVLCLLTAISFPIIFIATWKDEYRNAQHFYALMLLSQAGLMGVFWPWMPCYFTSFGSWLDSGIFSMLSWGR